MISTLSVRRRCLNWVVGAVVAERQLVDRRTAQRQRTASGDQGRCRRVGTRPNIFGRWRRGRSDELHVGSPGPFERKTPSGWHGQDIARLPYPAGTIGRQWRCCPRWRRIVRFHSEVVGHDTFGARHRSSYGSSGRHDAGHEVDHHRSQVQSTATCLSSVASSTVPKAPGMAPASRMWRVRRRVSTTGDSGNSPERVGRHRGHLSDCASSSRPPGEIPNHHNAAAEGPPGSRRRQERSRRSSRCGGR